MIKIFDMVCDIELVSVNGKYVNRQYALTRKYSNFKAAMGILARFHYKNAAPSARPLRIEMQAGTRKDIDNVIKPIIDAMQGIVFVNDSQIEQIEIKRIPKANKIERIEIKLFEVE